MQVGAVLLFEEHAAPGADELVAVVGRRAGRVPRLGERLRRPPWGCGRPFWEPAPPGTRRVVATEPAPVDDAGLVSAAVEEVLRRLPRDRPLWRAVVYADPAGRARGLVVVMHHVLADGIGGLAVLAELVDPGADPGADDDHEPAEATVTGTPSRCQLALDAWTERWSSLRSTPTTLRRAAAGLRELGAAHRPAAARGSDAPRHDGGRKRGAARRGPRCPET